MKVKDKPNSDGHRNWPPTKTTTENKAVEFDTRKVRDWLNPISMSTLKRAVARKETIVFLNGDEFTIEYGHVTKLPISGDRPCIKVRRTDAQYIVPFGYIAIDTLKNFQFEEKK